MMGRWFRFDCDAVRHPKVVELSDAEFRVWVEAIAYAAEHGTDGEIPAAWFRRLRVDDPTIEALVRVGLLDRKGDGYALHDYLEHQPPAAHWERISERGKKAAAARWSDAPSNAPCIASSNASRNATKTKTKTTREGGNREEGSPTSSAPRDDQWREVFGALIAACGGTRPETKSEQGKYARAADELRALGATASDVNARARQWSKTYTVPLTPPALVRNWSAMTPPTPRATGRFGESRVIGGVA